MTDLADIWKQPSSILFAAAIALGAIAAILLLGLAVRWIVQAVLRNAVAKEFGVPVPSSFRVQKSRDTVRIASFSLDHPAWLHAKKDGTRDLRRKDEAVVKMRSMLRLGRYLISNANHLALYDLVVRLRRTGVQIALCAEESAKHHRLAQRLQAHRAATSAAGIVDAFRSRPTEFEAFCADLLRGAGFTVVVTPPTNDGGFDLRMEKNGTTYIAECKLYAPTNRIGRPQIQKLVGANQTQRAQGMMFITTSGYSRDAVAFAEQAGVRLIDGTGLVALCARVHGERALEPEGLSVEQIELTKPELLAYMPPDLRLRYQ